MVNVNAYLSELTEKLLGAFSDRLLFVGLQGSYLRGDMTDNSDLDVMVVIRELSVDDLTVYRNLLLEMKYDVKSCGFICSEQDLANWNPLEICTLVHGTKAIYGELDPLVPKYTREDIRNFAKVSLNNLYHALCHRYIHGGPERAEALLYGSYKSTFFILQTLHYLRTGEYVTTKQVLLEKMTGMDKMVLENAIAPPNCDWKDSFSLLFAWCQKILADI